VTLPPPASLPKVGPETIAAPIPELLRS
jgi:hypothetical protein